MAVYDVWYNMKQRCDPEKSHQENFKTYIGCSISDNFKNLDFFKEWHSQQIGCSLYGYHLDKDILFEGNKIYSEDTCVLVPGQLNKFLVSCDASRGDYPRGVSFDKTRLKFVSAIRINSRSKYLGSYDCVEEAQSAYKQAKEAEAYRWYERLKVGEFLVDERVIERMRTWTLK